MVRCGFLKVNFMKNREESRKVFKEKELSYRDISKNEIDELMDSLKKELLSFKNNGFRMKLCALRNKDIEYGNNGEIKNCYLRVKGIIKGSSNGQSKDFVHFKEREAISFNTKSTDGEFIGFAGWADNTNVQPFLNAFISWVNEF